MKNIIIAFLILFTTLAAHADEASAIGSVSATVIDVTTLTQDTYGNIIALGQQPLYCASDSNGEMCYY